MTKEHGLDPLEDETNPTWDVSQRQGEYWAASQINEGNISDAAVHVNESLAPALDGRGEQFSQDADRFVARLISGEGAKHVQNGLLPVKEWQQIFRLYECAQAWIDFARRNKPVG